MVLARESLVNCVSHKLAKRKLTPCRSTGNLGQGDATLSVFPGGKRSTDNEKDGESLRFSLYIIASIITSHHHRYIIYQPLYTCDIADPLFSLREGIYGLWGKF